MVQQYIDPHCLVLIIRTANVLAGLVQISRKMDYHQTFSPATTSITSVIAAIKTTKNQLRKAADCFTLAKFFATQQIALK